jgi:hypothetical protein
MIVKQPLLIISLFVITANIIAQVEEPVTPRQGEPKEKVRFSDRMVFGGDIGLSFGSITYIKLAPIVGYRLTERFTAGLGPIYIYERYKDYNLESSTYGGKVVASFTVFKGKENEGPLGIGNILLHAENEALNIEPSYGVNNGSWIYYYFGDRVWIDNLLLGGGILQTISGNFCISILILWDVTRNKYSPYSNPILKFGFYF